MPKLLEHSVKGLIDSGKSESRAYAIATANLQKRGYLKKGTTELTAKGKRAQANLSKSKSKKKGKK
jgi:hypothetical protein